MSSEMKVKEFDNTAELEEVSAGLARASRHPVHVDLGTEYDERTASSLAQAELGETHSDVARRLEDVAVQDDLSVIWNNRANEREYMASHRYNLVQHREVIDAIREAVSRTTGSIEKGMVRDYGAHVDGVLVFGDQDKAIIDVEELVGDGYVPPEGEWPSGVRDRLGLGMRFNNSFDGRSGFGGTAVGYRFICGNWMIWGEEEVASRSSYHIKGDDDVPGVGADYFEEVIGSVFEKRDMLEGIVKEAAEDEGFPVEWAPSMLRSAGFGPDYAKHISTVLVDWTDGKGNTTPWMLYNAATHYLDHDRVNELGPERYEHHHGSAWNILEMDPDEHADDPADDLREFALGVEA